MLYGDIINAADIVRRKILFLSARRNERLGEWNMP